MWQHSGFPGTSSELGVCPRSASLRLADLEGARLMGQGDKCRPSRLSGDGHSAFSHLPTPPVYILDPSLQWQVLLVGVSVWGLGFWMRKLLASIAPTFLESGMFLVNNERKIKYLAGKTTAGQVPWSHCVCQTAPQTLSSS